MSVFSDERSMPINKDIKSGVNCSIVELKLSTRSSRSVVGFRMRLDSAKTRQYGLHQGDEKVYVSDSNKMHVQQMEGHERS